MHAHAISLTELSQSTLKNWGKLKELFTKSIRIRFIFKKVMHMPLKTTYFPNVLIMNYT